MKKIHLSNPKRKSNIREGKESWYDYYAGYSSDFVEDVINYIKPSFNSIIFDPWNGSGTTTEVSSKLGYKSIGFDINPVMVIVAKSKRIDFRSLHDLKIDVKKIISMAKSYIITEDQLIDDPLNVWLHPSGIIPFRKIENAILESNQTHKLYMLENNYEDMSNVVAFYYVALFKTIKQILYTFKSSNPTWIKRPKSTKERVFIEYNTVYDIFLNHVYNMIDAVKNIDTSINYSMSNISIAPSESLPLNNHSIDVVISSPPYCTRIDYAIATILELAILGYSGNDQLKTLRGKMIGTPTVSKNLKEPNVLWGEYANYILTLLYQHESKASISYYYKIYFQYFHGIFKSLEELDRVLKPNCYSVFVVQNSFYKDILVDLSKVFTEMASQLSWTLDNKFRYKKNTIAEIRKDYTKYRDSSQVEETVLIFKKNEK